jgi:hypothetical protein
VTDRQEGEVAQPKAVRLKDKIPALKQQMQQLPALRALPVPCRGNVKALAARRP